LSGNLVRVPLRVGYYHIVSVFSAFVHVPYVIANLRTPSKVEQAATAQSTIHSESTYVVPTTVDIDGLSLAPPETGLAIEAQRKHELLHLGYVARWESFRGVVIFRPLFLYEQGLDPPFFCWVRIHEYLIFMDPELVSTSKKGIRIPRLPMILGFGPRDYL
jgi:hypothetical protein